MLPAKQLSLWRFALSGLQRQLPVILLYVVESKGSSPGRPGFFMVINGAGEKEGSIGGGIMEHKFTEMAREQLRQDTPVISLRRQIHDKEVKKDQSGMICSGEQTILVYTLRQDDLPVLEQLTTSLRQHSNGLLQFSPKGIGYSSHPPEKAVDFQHRSDIDWEYQQKTGYSHRLYIVGGGHVALAFSRLMATMDFYIVLYDDRGGLDSFLRNDYTHEKKIIGNYQQLNELVTGGSEDYVVVMTQGYRTDDQAIRALIQKDFKYFGVLGSKTKVEKLMAAFRSEGFPEQRLGKLRAPAGLAIHSQTPEEIAVSIAAEIIQHLHAPEIIS